MIKSDPYRLVVVTLTVLAAALFAYPCLRLGYGYEIDYNEGWNAYHQLAAMAGLSPYADGGALFFNNYPPLSFYLIGLAGLVVGDPVLAGRLLSVAAVAVIAACCAKTTRAAGGDRFDAMLAAVTCLGLFSAFATDYVGIDDPQLLAQALLCCGFALYVSGSATPGRMSGVAALFAAGLLIKHNVLALPLVVGVHALWRAPMAGRAAFFGGGLVLAAIAAMAIQLAYGPVFFQQLLAPRTYDVGRGFLLTMDVLGRLQSVLAVVGLFLLLRHRDAVSRMVAAYLALGLAFGMGFAGGSGVDINIFFDAMIALALGTGLAATHLRREAKAVPNAAALFAVLANAGVVLFAPQALGRFAVDALGELELRQRLFAEDVAYLRSIPGPALCESMLLCHRAGKPMWVDPYNSLQATLTGRLPPDAVTGLIRDRLAAVAQISTPREHPLDEAPGLQVMPQRFANFGDPVYDALDASYRVERVGLSGRFYRPNP